MVEELQFIDAEQYQGKSDEFISIRMIILEHIRRIATISSKEFSGGYWQTITKMAGDTKIQDHIYVQDAREAYSNAVDVLHDILIPQFDKEMVADSEKYNKEFDKVKGKHKDYTSVEYKDEKQAVKRQMFQAISKFLWRINYLGSTQGYD